MIWESPYTRDTLKNSEKNAKNWPMFFFRFFRSKIFHCSDQVIYQSIELDFLYKTIYITFLCDVSFKSKKSKNSDFSWYKISLFLSILILCLWEESIAKKKFIMFGSPFNSASNDILDIVSKRSSSENVRLEYRPLTPYFTYF